MTRYVWPEPPRPVAFAVASPGYLLLGTAAFVTLILALAGWPVPALLALAATVGIALFFRDPDRPVPEVDGAVVSPADGRVVAARERMDHPYGEGPCVQVSIFMSVFNVHVNRMPAAGTVAEVRYHPGKFVAANLDKASSDNERNAVMLDIEDGRGRLVVVQVAGLIARRIICGVARGHRTVRGQRYGMICFGSRLDVYLPPGTRLQCRPGDRVRAGTSILAMLA